MFKFRNPFRKATLNEDGYEVNSGTPVVARSNLRIPSQSDKIRALIRHEMSREAADNGHETFEEADDFEIEGEEWISPYEETADNEDSAISRGPGQFPSGDPSGNEPPAVVQPAGSVETPPPA